MKVVKVLCTVLVAVAAFVPQSERILGKNVELTGDDLVDYVNKAQNLFTAKLSPRFSEYPTAIKRRLMGSKYVAIPSKYRVNEVTHDDIDDSAIPSSFDSRTQWPNCPSIKSIRDQSSCGSCWAFGAAEAMTDRICIASKGAIQFTVSADDLLSCCDECGFGCDGGFPYAAWNYWVEKGIVSGGSYTSKSGCKPYPFPPCEHHTNGTHYHPCPKDLYPTNTCEHKCQSGYATAYTNDKRYGAKAYTVAARVKAIQKEIMLHGPVEVAYDVYEDFEHYLKGIYKHTAGSYLGGHAVKMIGWGTENGIPYWICSNSWNSDWGENGFFRILRGTDECGIESGVVAGLPKI
uniref:Cathepsin B2 n=1 Tax=Dictyocaulus viviparus TaxID=29172 RepID=I6R107_DICVI|nr:cathepsin B2 [Dictyocaulus viviparus]